MFFRRLASDFSFSAFSVAVVAFASGIVNGVIILTQAAEGAKLSSQYLESWIIAGFLGMGIGSFVLSARYKIPLIVVWNAPAAVFLIGALGNIPYTEAIGGFLFSGVATFLLGITGWFRKVVNKIPKTLGPALLAGILLKIIIKGVSYFSQDAFLVLTVLITFFVARRIFKIYALISTLLFCSVLFYFLGYFSEIPTENSERFAELLWTTPSISWKGILNIGIPIFILVLTSQNLPGIFTLSGLGYKNIPISIIKIFTGILAVFLAPFGLHSMSLTSFTAALIAGPDAHPKLEKRYITGIVSGLMCFIALFFVSDLITIVKAFPKAFTGSIIAIGLSGGAANALCQSFENVREREINVLVCTLAVCSFEWMGMTSTIWALIVGVFGHIILSLKK